MAGSLCEAWPCGAPHRLPEVLTEPCGATAGRSDRGRSTRQEGWCVPTLQGAGVLLGEADVFLVQPLKRLMLSDLHTCAHVAVPVYEEGERTRQKSQSSLRPGVWCLLHTLSTSAVRHRLKLHKIGSSSVTGKRIGEELTLARAQSSVCLTRQKRLEWQSSKLAPFGTKHELILLTA
ncbi:hypothetical protein EYF80_029925 [Liparis tanakae]|uniref:Uncharacterized protein n=1 Tax=Liparis tanakae TaxID=230148 RepID=A0A4Z2H266_9TELE|nr:hypothetical protein EYF80_029925 [Liparis tanakae]